MNQTVLKQTSQHTASSSLARLSEPHGYRFDGDIVQLQTRLTVLDHSAHDRAWALQLWACHNRPTHAKDLDGHIVAKVNLPPMSEAADDIEHLEMNTFASPPAGTANYFMVLVLASGRPGQFEEIHDIAVYPQQQLFLQPRLSGSVGYRIQGNRVHLSIERIENPRDVANRSGTLALELWALPAPHAGGSFEGVPLAGLTIGSLPGQADLANTSLELPFVRPPAGQWHFVLMLREWTPAGYITRDFTNFNTPVTYGSIPATTAVKAPAAAPDETAAIKPTEPVNAVVQPAVPQPIENKRSTIASLDVSRTVIPDNLKATRTAAPNAVPKLREPISVNTAAEEQLATLDGLSPKLARAIVKKRPFASLDDLRGIQGISAKLLAAIRARLKL